MKRLIFLVLVVALYSCNKGGLMSNRPHGILSKEKMEDVFVDINLAESSLRVGNVQHFSLADSMYQKSMYLYIFEKHHVTPDEFRNSLSYYTKDIDALNEIFTEVIDRLNNMEAELRGKPVESKSEKKDGPKESPPATTTKIK